jgi:CBS domain-containing protein
MATDLVTIQEDSDVFDAFHHMKNKGIRRLPVVDDKGGLVGIVTMDDLLLLLVDEINALSRLVDREQKNEASSRP